MFGRFGTFNIEGTSRRQLWVLLTSIFLIASGDEIVLFFGPRRMIFAEKKHQNRMLAPGPIRSHFFFFGHFWHFSGLMFEGHCSFTIVG